MDISNDYKLQLRKETYADSHHLNSFQKSWKSRICQEPHFHPRNGTEEKKVP